MNCSCEVECVWEDGNIVHVAFPRPSRSGPGARRGWHVQGTLAFDVDAFGHLPKIRHFFEEPCRQRSRRFHAVFCSCLLVPMVTWRVGTDVWPQCVLSRLTAKLRRLRLGSENQHSRRDLRSGRDPPSCRRGISCHWLRPWFNAGDKSRKGPLPRALSQDTFVFVQVLQKYPAE